MRNFIKFIKLPGTSSENLLELGYPSSSSEDPHNVINVICGLNNTGKSFLLERVRASLETRWKFLSEKMKSNSISDRNVIVNMLSPISANNSPKILFFGKTWQDKRKAGIIGLDKDITKFPGDIPDYKRIIFKFLYRQLMVHLKRKESVDIQTWLENNEIRKQSLNQFKIENVIYKCSNDDPVVKKIENILDAKLYFRRAMENTVDLVLVHGDDTQIQYSEWSDGQQTLFYTMTLLADIKPDIVLLDEIENHLHPAFMTEVLKILKEDVGQSIICTHHPHVIFSEFTDKVFYIQAFRPPSDKEFPLQVPYQKQQQQKSPKRTVVTLEDQFDKITAVYHLFDHKDQQILKQANRIKNDSEILFYTTLTKIFKRETVRTSSYPLPDKQSTQILERLKNFIEGKKKYEDVKILDFGSGAGRQPGEFSKISNWQLKTNINWFCWEPEEKNRKKLRSELERRKIEANIPDNIDDIQDKSVDFCVVANVLHELTPIQFSDLVYNADKKVKKDGEILILELYPLLISEKFAVPYPAVILNRLFQNLGFISSFEQIPVRDTTAYCLTARRKFPDEQINPKNMQNEVENAWEEILDMAVQSYSNRRHIHNYEGYRALIQDMTTISSIQTWKRLKTWIEN